MGFTQPPEAFRFSITFGWSSQRDDGDCGTRTRFPDFVLSPLRMACSAIRRRESSCCAGDQKNDLRVLRSGAERLVRSARATRPRTLERPVSDLSAVRYPLSRLSSLRHREARGARVAGGQPVLHAAICDLCRPALPQRDDQGSGPRVRPRDRGTVKTLDKQYMRAHLKRAGTPGSTVIGIDGLTIRKGHTYRIEVSDLEGPFALLHQGPEVRAALPSAEPKGPGAQEPQAPARRQQAPQYRLPAQGVLRPALGLLERGLGPEVLRQLACSAQVAAFGSVRRSSLR